MKYRKKPVVIESFCLGVDCIPDWFMDRVSANEIILRGDRGDLQCAEINTFEGVVRADKGDYVIRGINGEPYPIKAEILHATYEPVTEKA